MTWETLNCVNHPDRPAIERCEVCGKPLCAYCLYYTEDGQRLCDRHAEEARRRGLTIEEPGAYADQLIGAQAAMVGKRKRGSTNGDETLYRGNSHDLGALVAMLIGLISLTACCGGFYCLPPVGLILSLLALLNAKHAYDPSRTRKLGFIGLAATGVWVVLIAGCFLIYGASMSAITTSVQSGPVQVWNMFPSATPRPTDTPTPSPTPEVAQTAEAPDSALSDAAPTLPQ